MSDDFGTINVSRGERAREIEVLRQHYRQHREALVRMTSDAPTEHLAAEYQRLIVEIDHPYTHSSKRSFEDDRRRDTRLQLAGYRVIRITYGRLYNDPAGVIADIRTLLAKQPRL